MRIEGNVECVSHRGKIIARFPSTVETGSEVIDNRNKKVGTVSWIFGPVDSPYTEIEPPEGYRTRFSLAEKKIYVEEDNDDG